MNFERFVSLSCTKLSVSVHEYQIIHSLGRKVHTDFQRKDYFCFVERKKSNTKNKRLHEKELNL